MDKKRNINYILIVPGIIFGTLLICIIYLSINSFKINYEFKTIEDFLNEKKPLNQLINKDNKIELEIPINVANTEILMIMKEVSLPSYYKIKNVQLDANQRKININGSVYGIKFPISMPFEPKVEGNKIIFQFGNIEIGRKAIKLSEKKSDKIKSFLFKNSMPILIDTSILFSSNIIKAENIEWTKEGLKVFATINYKLIKQEIRKIKSFANEEIVQLFENSDIDAQRKAVEYVINIENLSEKDIQALVDDILLESKITENILLLGELEVLEEIFNKYGNILNIDKSRLLEKRNQLLGTILSAYRESIWKKLKNHYFSLEPMYINKGQPYSFLRRGYITIEDIAKEQNINIPKSTLKRLSFCYDKSNDLLLISYRLNNDLYLLSNNNEVTTISTQTYKEKFNYESTGRVSHVNDKLTWDSLESEIKDYFQTEEVFIRYMKADDKFAFAVASPKYNYQNFRAIAFEKKNDYWGIIEENIKSLTELNKKYPLFNLETATNEIEKVTFYHLGEEMFNVILEDLVNKGIIKSKDDYTIEYCSYGNDYIAFLLSNKVEYIYKVYSMYLQKVYEKETAEKMWDDLPEIITLQNPPTNE